MKTIALIPARGGSERIPKKNIINLCGKPLISYSIETAKKCRFVDEVWVSTDNKEIAKISKGLGANVLMRPPEFSTATASSEEALLHLADKVNFDIMVFMQATSPLTLPKHIEEGIEIIKDRQADSCLAVSEDVRFYWNAQRKPINYNPMHRPRTQEKERWYKETGAFYITTKDQLLKSKCRIGGRIEFVIVPEQFSYEIDTYNDLKLIEKIISQ